MMALVNGCSSQAGFGSFTDMNGLFKPPPGTLVYGPLSKTIYRIDGLLSHCGYSATMLRATDTKQSRQVVIKAMHPSAYHIGKVEQGILQQLTAGDPYDVSHTVKVLDHFVIGRHYCLVFEQLNPDPSAIRKLMTDKSHNEVLSLLRQLGLQLLKAVAYTKSQHFVHADLKPDNVLLRDPNKLSSMYLIDFGNAVFLTPEALEPYYKNFDVQTLNYRAPEVMFGLEIGSPIDVWSVGVMLAELYMEFPHALFYGPTVKDIAKMMTEFLGPVPLEIFCHGKFFPHLYHLTAPNLHKFNVFRTLMKNLRTRRGEVDIMFVNLLSRLLEFDPARRATPIFLQLSQGSTVIRKS